MEEAAEFLINSKRPMRIATLKSGKNNSGQINPTNKTKKSFQVEMNKSYKETEGICDKEIQRKKSEGECLHCAWPSNRKGAH